MKIILRPLLPVLWALASFALSAQVTVDVNFDMRHTVGGVEVFDREKFIVVHAGPSENDYNDQLDKLETLMNGYDAYYGRETGRMRFVASRTGENSTRSGFPDPADIANWGTTLNNGYANNTARHALEKGRTITAAQSEPFYPNGANAVNPGADAAERWFFSTNNTVNEPFGSATGQFMGLFLRDAYGNGGTSGTPRPELVEVMNEPVWPLVDVNLYGGGTIDDIFALHLAVADSVKAYNPGALIGGFCTAFPDFEKNGLEPGNNQLFGQWEERWRRFIDEIGPSMDFYSLHLYDFHSIGGKKQLRKGSNMEATLDMLEHYSTISDGAVKPMVISEYGAQLNDFYGEAWSPARDWLILKSFSNMLMQFMERPNTIEKTVPFALHKADFFFGGIAPDRPYPWRLLRRANEPASYTGDWVFTEVVKFYELWSDVNGTRVDTRSTDPDLMVDAFVDGASNKAYLILNSLDETALGVDLAAFGFNAGNVTDVEIKHLYFDAATASPKLDVTGLSALPASVTVGEEACMIIELTFATPPAITETSTEEKIYATTYKQAITAGQAVSFTIPGISVGARGEAVLRLGIGRAPSAQRFPTITVNGTNVDVNPDFRGDNQVDRDVFFGVLEVPVPYNLLINGANAVTVTFPDAGGFVSSCALQTFDFSRPVTRSDMPDRPREITFTNRAAFVPSGGTVPVFNAGEQFAAEIIYQTGMANFVEEDLNYIAMQLREVDENSAIVRTTAFQAVVNGNAPNEGITTIDYMLPTSFPDGTTVPNTADLDPGHRLILLIFMSVDSDAGFANANTEIVIGGSTNRPRMITFVNEADYIPGNDMRPTFMEGQSFSVTLNYSTGITGGAEEDLVYAAMMVRQVDTDFNIVNTSTFQVVVPGSAANEDEVTFDYTLPATFDDGQDIPTTAMLPAGHRLVLIIFMSVDDNAFFANDNTQIVIDAALPLNLLTFGGVTRAKDNRLNWRTVNEEAFSHFEVERLNVNSNGWEKLGAVAGTGDVGGQRGGHYSFVDHNPTRVSPYRLRLVDLDGTFAYGKAILLEREDATALTVYPNPGAGRFLVRLPEVEAGQLTLYDLAGRKVWQQRVGGDVSVSNPSPDAESLARGYAMDFDGKAGVYLLVVTTADGKRWMERIVVR